MGLIGCKDTRKRRSIVSLALLSFAVETLFLSEEDVDGCAVKVPFLAHFVFNKALVWIADVLGQIGVVNKRGNLRVGHLRAVFYLDVLALHGWWRRGFDDGQHFCIQL